MKILKTKTLVNGRKRITVEIDGTGHMICIEDDAFYTLGYPLEEQVVQSHHLKDIKRVAWDAYSQKWVDA